MCGGDRAACTFVVLVAALASSVPEALLASEPAPLRPRWEARARVHDLAAAEGVLYTVEDPDLLVARQVADGRELWRERFELPAHGSISLRVVDDTLVVASGRTVQLFSRDGRKRCVARLAGPLGGFPDSLEVGTVPAIRHGPVAGPPLVAVTGESGPATLVQVGDDCRLVPGPLIPEGVNWLARAGEVLLVHTSDPAFVVALDPSTLTELWRTPAAALGRLDAIDGAPHLVTRHASSGSSYHALEGRQLPRRTIERPGRALGPIELILTGDPSPTIERHTGSKPLWTATLPGPPTLAARAGGRVVVACDRDGDARALLVAIDDSTGRIVEMARGLVRPSRFLSLDRMVASLDDDGLAVFDVEGFASAEPLDIEAEVERLLARGGGGLGDDLRRLGDAAVPLLGSRIPALTAGTLAVVAPLLADAGWKAAAPALAARLQDPWPVGDGDMALRQVLAALDVLAGPPEVPALAGLALSRDDHAGRHARFVLAGLGTAEAVAAVERTTPPPLRLPDGPWWPPALVPAPHLTVKLADGGRVFHHDGLGAFDLWFLPADGPAVLLGPSCLPRRKEAQRSGDLLTYRCDEGPPLRFDLGVLRRDGDGDGIPDQVEARLALDPRRADSDGDGVPDPSDPTPNAAPRGPGSEEDELAAWLFAEVVREDADGPGGGGLLVVVTEEPRAWAGRPGPTLAFDERAYEAFLAARPGVAGGPLVLSHAGPAARVRPDGRPGCEGASAHDDVWTVERFSRLPRGLYTRTGYRVRRAGRSFVAQPCASSFAVTHMSWAHRGEVR
jgi:hypothetical protein